MPVSMKSNMEERLKKPTNDSSADIELLTKEHKLTSGQYLIKEINLTNLVYIEEPNKTEELIFQFLNT